MAASPRRLIATVAAVGVLVVPVAAAHAVTGSVDDGDDATAPLDVARVVHRDDAATLSWEVSSHSRFDDDDVTTCLWSMEGRDREVSVGWGTSSLVGLVRDGAGRSVAPAHVVRVSSDAMRVSVRRADVGDPSSYRYFVSCLSDADRDGRIESGESDTVPGGDRLVTHSVSPSSAADGVRRIAGGDRVDTSIALSRDGWKNGTAGAVVLASSSDFADALAGTPLAAARRGPLLLNPHDALDPRVTTEIERVLPASGTGRVYVLGGEDALSDAVASSLTAEGWEVRRLGGPDRFATSVAVAEELGHPSTVLLADGLDFPDGLSAGAAAARLKASLLLTAGRIVPVAVQRELAEHRPTTRYAVGAEAAAADPTAEAVVGVDRYDTARRVADRFFTQPSSVLVASGTSFPDGLAAGARAAASGAPVLLTGPRSVPSTVFSWLQFEAASIATAGVAGGLRVVTDEVVVGLLDAVN